MDSSNLSLRARLTRCVAAPALAIGLLVGAAAPATAFPLFPTGPSDPDCEIFEADPFLNFLLPENLRFLNDLLPIPITGPPEPACDDFDS